MGEVPHGIGGNTLANRPSRLFPLFNITSEAGTADVNFYAKAPMDLVLLRMDGSADNIDGTDKVVATLSQGSTTLYALTLDGTAVVVDTVGSDADTPSGVTTFWPADTLFTLNLNYSGTAANVKGLTVTVWAQAVR